MRESVVWLFASHLRQSFFTRNGKFRLPNRPRNPVYKFIIMLGNMAVAEELTVIINSSFIPAHPRTEIIEKTLESLSLVGVDSEVPILVTQDALRRSGTQRVQGPLYEKYLLNLAKFAKSRSNIKILKLPKWGHISGSLKFALPRVTTPFVLVVQHDLPFVREVPLGNLMAVMRDRSHIKHVRFNINPLTRMNWDAEYECADVRIDRRGFITQERFSASGVEVPLLRTLAWSDNNYVCSTQYLNQVVFPLVGSYRTPPEHVLNPLGTPERHHVLGTYIFGEIDELPYIAHLDGRNSGSEKLIGQLATRERFWHPVTRHLDDKWQKIRAKRKFSRIEKVHTRFLSYGLYDSIGPEL